MYRMLQQDKRQRDRLGLAQTRFWKLPEIRERSYKGRLSVCLGKEGRTHKHRN